MADTNIAKPRPKPRPRPKAKPANAVAGSSSKPSASSSSSSRIPLSGQVDDEDEMFLKNRNRSMKTWQKLEELNKETKLAVNSDSDDEATPRKRSKKADQLNKPKWQTANAVRLLSADLSDDSDEGIEFVGTSSTSNGARLGKRRRQRSRSRSITPPPALPQHQIQHARNIVREALGAAPRHASPTAFDCDDLTDTIVLDPELERIAKSITSQSHRASSPSLFEPDEEIILTVNWQPHPLNEAGKKEVWQYKMNRNDDFRELFEATAEDACILVDSLIMTYRGKRIFSSVTPQTLKIRGAAEMAACDKTTYDYVRRNPHVSTTTSSLLDNTISSQVVDITDDDSDDASSPPSQPAQTQESDAESEADGDKFKLILRSVATGERNITLTVRPTTKCGAIVKAFLKKAGVADQYPAVFGEAAKTKSSAPKKGGKKSGWGAPPEKDPRLCVDGEKLDNGAEIGDWDLEEGDLVEVVGM